MITERIFHWAKLTPNRTAVVYNGRPRSYRAFAQQIAAARGYFARQGYAGSGCAALVIDNLMEFWIFSLALRSLGLTTVAMRAPATVGKLGLADLRCVVTSAGETWPDLDSACGKLGLPLLSVSLDGEAALDLEAPAPAHPPGGHILWTSGTTGASKLVLMSAAVDAVMLPRKVDAFGMNQDTVLCTFNFPAWTGPGYRFSASPWTVGGAVVIEQAHKPHEALNYPGITHAVLVPGLLATILSAPADAFPRSDTMQLAVGGGAMTRRQVERTKARITPHLFNWLASTEAGGIALTPLHGPEDHRWHRILPGRVVEIVDEAGRPAPTGEVGRVRVATAGGPTRYLNNQAATRVFFKDGFFYPGDLGVFRSDGRMALHGRFTDIINLAGRKFSPVPIEDRLTEVLGVSAVYIFAMQEDSGEEGAHVVLETSTPIDRERLKAALKKELPGFPRTRVYYVAEFPRNQMGKLLRQELRAKAIAGLAPSAKMDQSRS